MIVLSQVKSGGLERGQMVLDQTAVTSAHTLKEGSPCIRLLRSLRPAPNSRRPS